MARALYFQSKIPIQFWTECILTGLTNKTPSPLIGNRTPYELLYQAPIDYTSFIVFGCLTFASTLLAHRTKFQPRAKVCFPELSSWYEDLQII